MNRKLLTGFVSVFLFTQVVEGLVSYYLLDATYTAHTHLWRPIGEMKLWMFPITGGFFSFFFVYLFSRGYEAKGIAEGFRYGISIALMVALPSAYEQYAVMQIPYFVTLELFLSRSLEYIAAGILLSVIFTLHKGEPVRH